MFFSTNDDDDGSGFSIGMPSSGSKLSSLFGTDRSSFNSGNESLKYTAPKQPKSKEEEARQAALATKEDTPSLLFACACHTYRHVNGQYIKQGKLGAAVLGHLPSKDYKILLYVSQKKPVTNAKIHPTFAFNVQKNNYATFYDDQSQNWSLCFDSEAQQIEFTKWVALAKFNVSVSTLVLQDLNAMEGQVLQKGDTVEMQYTGWLHAGNAFGKIFDSNKDTGKLFKFKIGKGKVIKGWDTGVVGMKKASKRLLIVPPELAYGSKAVGDRLPPNSTLIFEVQVTRAKFVNPETDTASVMSTDGGISEAKSGSVSETNPSVETSTSNVDTVDKELIADDSLKGRTKSISEQLSRTPENTKSKLLERMSKMGHSMMPATPGLQKSISTEPVEDVLNESQPDPIERQTSHEQPTKPDFAPKPSLKPCPESPKPMLRPRPEPVARPVISTPTYEPAQNSPYAVNPNSMYMPAVQQLALYQSPQATHAAMFGMTPAFPQVSAFQQPAAMPQSSGLSTAEMNLMMTEGKLRHNELKNDLSRLIEKIDAIGLKVEIIENKDKQIQPFQASQIYTQGPEMEGAIIMQNITRIIKENEKLHTDCEEKNKKIELLNERMTDLLTKNQQFFEKSNQLFANQTDSMQSNAAQAMLKVSTLETQNIKLESDLSTTRMQLLQAKKREELNVSKEAESIVQIEGLKEELKKLKENAEMDNSSTSEHEAIVQELKEKLKSERKEQKQLRIKFEQIDEEHSEIKLERDSLTKTLNDFKKKRKEDKTKYEEEIEEAKAQHEEEIKSLKQRHKKSTGSESEKLATLEEEISIQFEEKMKMKLTALEDQHNKVMETLNKENNVLAEKLQETQIRMDSLSIEASTIKDEKFEFEKERNDMEKELLNKLNHLNKQLKDAEDKVIKLEYENSSTVLNNNQEDQIIALKNEKDELQDKVIDLQQQHDDLVKVKLGKDEEIKQLKKDCESAYDRGIESGRSTLKTISAASYEKGYSEGKASMEESKREKPNDVASNKAVVADEVKKVMNSVFFKLRGDFQVEESYNGKDVVAAILKTIKEVTLKMTSNDESESEEESEEEDEKSEEEGEEEDEESEEEEEEEETMGELQQEGAVNDEVRNVVHSVDGYEKKVQPETLADNYVSVENIEDLVKTDITDCSSKQGNEVSASGEDVVKDTSDGLSKQENEASCSEDVVQKESPPLLNKQETEGTVSEDALKAGPNTAVTESSHSSSDDLYETDEGESAENKDLQIDNDLNEKDNDSNLLHEEDRQPVLPVEYSESLEAKTKNVSMESKELVKGNKEENVNTLKEVGLDSSIFGENTEPTDEAKEGSSVVTKEVKEVEPVVDERSLSFSIAQAKTVKTGSKASLFDDDDDDDDFFKSKSKTEQKASAFSRSPPPLFEDDDDDTNWI